MRTSSSLIKTSINSLMLTALMLQSFSGLTNLTYASAPFIQTRISVASDGFVPFDATTFALPNINAGTDADATNGVVRVTDTMRYKIEVAVNDSANAGNLISTVRLDPSNTIAPLPRQKWKAIPDTCIASGSSISSDEQTLVCNLGTYREGTNAIYYAEARVTQHNRNGNHIAASTTATAAGANTATSGPTDTITTAGFGVDLVKTLKPPYKNTSGDIIYTPDANVDLLGNPGGTGYMVTYRISADYVPGSAFASGDASNKANYTFSDTFQYLSGYLAANAVFAGCSDVGGNMDDLLCDYVGKPLGSGGTAQGIILEGVDLHAPVDGNKIFAIDVRYWIPVTDIRTDGTPLTNRNDVVFTETALVEFLTGGMGIPSGIRSYIYDQSGFNPNDPLNGQPLGQDGQINGSEGLSNNGMNYPLFRVVPGGYSVRKTFWGYESYASEYMKNGGKKVTAGETISTRINMSITNKNIKGFYACDNINNQYFDFISIGRGLGSVARHNSSLIIKPDGFFRYTFRRAGATSDSVVGNMYKISGQPWEYDQNTNNFFKIEYTNLSHTLNTNSSSPQRDSDCRDDLNGDNIYDWVDDPNNLTGGPSSVTKVRIHLKPDYEYLFGNYPGDLKQVQIDLQLDLKVKINTPIGVKIPNYLPITNLANLNNPNLLRHNLTSISDNPTDTNYSFHVDYADRVTVVGAKASISKSFNSLTNIATPGDTLSFTITPQVGGAYIPANGTVPSITVTDQLPASNTLVSWTGSCPAGQSVTLASPSANPLVWTISGAAVGQPTCTIDYTVKLSETAGKGDYINTARIDVCDPALANDCGVLDKEVDSAGDDTIPIRAVAGYSVVAKGVNFDVLKTSPDLIRPIDSSFIFNLSYANLGIENFSAGSGLDILPYNGDSYMTGTSGPNTSRSPGTNYHGSYKITTLTAANGEYNWQYTTADPTTLINEASNPNTSATWTSFSPASVASLSGVTAIRWSFPASAVTAGALRKTIAMTITPSDNWSGDIYTNSFSAKVPEMSFPVISNDVSVQVVAGSIGDTVWIDDNSDGVIDSGEQLLPGVPVTLYASDGTTLITTGVTNMGGQYLFTGLVAGSYHVQITPPAGLTPTYDLDSGTGNLSTLNNRTLVTLTENRDSTTNALGGINSIDIADFGLYSTLGSIAGHVYHDTNANSGYETSDIYLGGITVNLLSGGVVIATGTTNASGAYLFPAVVPGTYDVSYMKPVGYQSHHAEIFSIQMCQPTVCNLPVDPNTGEPLGSCGPDICTSSPVPGTSITNITTINIVLASQQHSINNDFGLVTPYDLAIAKTADIGTGTSDDTVTYTIIYGNVGGRPVSNVQVRDLWPSNHLNFVSASPAPTSPTSPTLQNPLVWNIGSLGINQTGSITVTATIKSGLASGTVIDNIAAVYTSDDTSVVVDPSTGIVTGTGELGYANNTSSTTQTTADTDLVITKTTDTPFVIKGDTLNWTINYHNAGPATARDVSIYDLIPTGLSYLSSSLTAISDTMVSGGRQLIWNIGDLLSGTTGSIVVTTQADLTLVDNTPVYNTVVISGSTTERLLTNNASVAQTVPATATGSFDGYVWYDSDNSSSTGNQYGYTEAAASGVVVEIYNTSGVLITTLTTDSNGQYQGVLPIGDYMTNIIVPARYSLTTPNNTQFTIIRDTAQHVDDDGLYHKPGTFTASVWYDNDSSQTKNTTESPVRGTQVMVYDTNNTLVGTYTTNSDGAINGSLIPGAYTFRLNDIINYINTTQQSIQFTILSETDHHVHDFGIVQNLAPGATMGSSSPAPVSTPTPVVTPKPVPTPVVKAPTPVADPVHETAPEQTIVQVISTTPTAPKQVKSITKQAWDTKEVDTNKIAITLDEVKVEQLHNAPDLSPRTFVLPTKLLDTGTPVALLAAKGISVSTNPVVETQMDEWIQPVSAELAATMTLDDWIARIPQNIMNVVDEEEVQQWIIIPSLGVVTPVTNIPESNADWTNLVNGGEIGINDYLKKGVVHYPLSKQAGEIGNMIIAGHSSYYKKDDGLFKTIFASLPLLNAGDKVIVYQKKITITQSQETTTRDSFSNKSSEFIQYVYRVNNSYQITPYDTWILNSRPTTSHITLFTCTPIGSNKNRWYIDATLE